MSSFWDNLKLQWDRTSDGAKWSIGEIWRRIPFKFLEPNNEHHVVPLGFLQPETLYNYDELIRLLSLIKNHQFDVEDFNSAGDFLAFYFAPPEDFFFALMGLGLIEGTAYNTEGKIIYLKYKFLGLITPNQIDSSNLSKSVKFIDFLSYCSINKTAKGFKLLR